MKISDELCDYLDKHLTVGNKEASYSHIETYLIKETLFKEIDIWFKAVCTGTLLASDYKVATNILVSFQ